MTTDLEEKVSFLLFCDFFLIFIIKTDVNVPLKNNKRKAFEKIMFYWHLVSHWQKSRRIWIRIRKSVLRIHGSVPKCHGSTTLLSNVFDSWRSCYRKEICLLLWNLLTFWRLSYSGFPSLSLIDFLQCPPLIGCRKNHPRFTVHKCHTLLSDLFSWSQAASGTNFNVIGVFLNAPTSFF